MVQLFNDWPHFARKWKEGEFAKRMHDRHANEAPMKASIDALRAAPTGSDESGAFGALLQVTKSLWRGLGEGDFLEWQAVPILRVEQGIGWSIGLTRNPVGDVHPHRVLAGHDACPSRAANRTGGVALSKTHAGLGQAIDVGRLVECASVGPDVSPAHVVHKEEQKVGLLGGVKRRRGCDKNAEGVEAQRVAEFGCFHFSRSVGGSLN